MIDDRSHNSPTVFLIQAEMLRPQLAVSLLSEANASQEEGLNLDPHIRRSTLIISNQTSKRLVGLAVIWKLTDKRGKTTSHKLFSDGFKFTDLRHIAKAGSAAVVFPYNVLPIEMIGKNIIGPRPIQRDADRFGSALRIEIQVDSAIFENGHVVGPDNLKYPAEIIARKSAAKSIVDEVNRARSSGQNEMIVISGIARESPNGADKFALYRVEHARALVRRGDIPAGLQALANFPDPPKFFH